jgi:hypothetical protein
MKSLLDPFVDCRQSVETESRETFERLWRELDRRERLKEDADRRTGFWLECNGELIDSGSVKVLGVRKSALGVKLVEFVCPFCGQRHESIRFG